MNKSIKCGNCHGIHGSVAEVKACYGISQMGASGIPSQAMQVREEPITLRQLPFLLTLAAERPMWADVNNLHADVIPKLTKEQANQAITEALTMKPEKATPAAKGKAPEGTRASLRAVPLEDGIYRLDQDGSDRQSDEHYLVYHTVHGANEQVAKKLLLVDTGETDEDGKTIWKGEWEYAGKKALRFLTPVMKLNEADAKQFGIVYGICVRCARTLTKEESKEVGYGATCAGHEGWWYPTKAELREIKLRAKTEAK